MRRIFLYTLLVFPVVFILSCKPQPQKEVKRNIILDVDVSVDDMMTILYFLACPDIDIKAITIESGVSCVDSGAAIVHRLLKMTGRTEIPVASGTGIPIAGNNYFPKEWQPPVDSPFGLELPEYAPEASAPDAVSLIAQLAGTYKDNITILALGPMTNIAGPKFAG
jgi:inosine-uridine nucleoside N-ribohydrolase